MLLLGSPRRPSPLLGLRSFRSVRPVSDDDTLSNRNAVQAWVKALQGYALGLGVGCL